MRWIEEHVSGPNLANSLTNRKLYPCLTSFTEAGFVLKPQPRVWRLWLPPFPSPRSPSAAGASVRPCAAERRAETKMSRSHKRPNVCRYFAASGSCHFGDHCAFQHVRGGPLEPVEPRKPPAGEQSSAAAFRV